MCNLYKIELMTENKNAEIFFITISIKAKFFCFTATPSNVYYQRCINSLSAPGFHLDLGKLQFSLLSSKEPNFCP